jgi:predicted nucleic acid-binding protein
LTGVADTRLLLSLEFPPDDDTKESVERLTRTEIARRLLAPSIILTEFLKIAGARIGVDAARVRIQLLKDRGMRVVPVGEEEALAAGKLLLSHSDVPIADSLIASFVATGIAEYVVSDDPHFKTLGIRTKWLSAR